MRKISKFLAVILSLIMVIGTINTVPVSVKAATKDLTLGISLDDGMPSDQRPTNYNVSFEAVDETGERIQDSSEGSVNQDTTDGKYTFSLPEEVERVKITVVGAGKDIYLNGEQDNSWENGKIISVSDLADSYMFVLKQPGGGGGSDAGEIKFDINEGGSVYYSEDGSSWNEVFNNSGVTPSASGTIYLKAVPSVEHGLDRSSNQLFVRYGNDDHFINGGDLDSLLAGTYSFPYDSSDSCAVRIRFVNGGGGDPLPLSTFSMTFGGGGDLNIGTVYYQTASDEWHAYNDGDGEIEFTRLVIEPPADGKDYYVGGAMDHETLPGVSEPEFPEPDEDELENIISAREDWGGIWARRGWKYTFTNIALNEDTRDPSTLIFEPYDTANGAFYYLGLDGEVYQVPSTGINEIPAKEVWVEIYTEGYALDVNSLFVGCSITGVDTDEVKRTLNSGDSYWLDREKCFEFRNISFIAEDKPIGQLTVENYNNTYGKIYYQNASDAWIEVDPSGATVEAKAVKAVGIEPKYTLRETRDGNEGWHVLVVGGTFDNPEPVQREFENHFSADQQAEIKRGFSYNLSNLFFETGRATFRWSYSDGIPGHEDEYVGNGVIEITAAEYNGAAVANPGNHDADVYWINNSQFNEFGRQWAGGEGAFLPGTVVTITLVPARGYQLTRFQINGQANTTTAQDTVSTFTFTVPSKNFHLGATFSEMDDEVKSSASGISGGALDIGDGEFENGTAALEVSDTSVSVTEESEFLEQAEGYSVDKYVDLTVQNIFYQGNTTDYWPGEEKHQLDSEATISLNVSGLTGSEVEIVHQKGSGEYEIIPATYSNGVVTFLADSFSKFAIVSKGAAPEPNPEPTPDNNDGDGVKPDINSSNSGGLGIPLDPYVLLTDIAKAPVGSTITIDRRYNRQFLTNAEMKALLKNKTVSIRMQYEYKGIEYDITIPAGAALDNDIPIYGPLCIARFFPATKVFTDAPSEKEIPNVPSEEAVAPEVRKYIVQRGDSLSKIARKVGISLEELRSKNPQVGRGNLIFPGQEILY